MKTILSARFSLATFDVALALSLMAAAQAPAKDKGAEIKFVVAEEKVAETLEQIQKWAAQGSTKHQIYFFDTSDLKLYQNSQGPVILRARQKGTKPPESTVKLRRDRREPELEKKCADAGVDPEIQLEVIIGKEPAGTSYALDKKYEGKALAELEGADAAAIAGWISAKQHSFLKAAGLELQATPLRAFGPIDAEVWEWTVADPRIGGTVTAELWRLGGKQILELSCKRDAGGDAAKEAKDFADYFKEQKILPVADPQSKTKQALDHFSRSGR